jgi:hypothetical protein
MIRLSLLNAIKKNLFKQVVQITESQPEVKRER